MAGGVKKGKGGSKSKGGKGKESKGNVKRTASSHQEEPREAQLPPQERVQAVRPFWETLTQEQRVQLLSLSIDELRAKAADVTARLKRQSEQAAEESQEEGAVENGAVEDICPPNLGPTVEDLFEEGINRLHHRETWKLWRWPQSSNVFYSPDEFKRFIEEDHLEEDLRKYLPREDGKAVEKPAEAQLRTKMSELLQKVQAIQRVMQDEPVFVKTRGGRYRDTANAVVRDPNLEAANLILQELENEHEFLYNAVITPVINYILEVFPEGSRDTKPMELAYEDLEKLSGEEVMRICEWLTDKVDGFSARIKPEPKDVEEEEEEGIGDVDLFALDKDNEVLTVNAKWLHHLQERLLGEDGNPRKTKDSEDPFRMGLVLEWVYGTIVSTAEKARDSAKKSLGRRQPSPEAAHDTLCAALQEQASWEQRAHVAKELLHEMLKSRRVAADLQLQYDIKPVTTTAGGIVEPSDLPDHVVLKMLHREVLLTKAKLHALHYEQAVAERKLRTLKSQLRQGEPEFERLKRELEEVKNAPRGLEGTFRTAAEMERHRAQLADAAIEEQLEVQTAFREHGARLQQIYDKRQRTDMDIARREQEMKQLQGWKQTVQSLIERFTELTTPADSPLSGMGELEDGSSPEDAELGKSRAQRSMVLQQASQRITQANMSLHKLRTHFHKDVRRQLYSMDDDRTFFDWIQKELRAVEKRLEDGRAVLAHLEGALINVSCNDPGAVVGQQLSLPILQERLDARARDYAAQRAAAAEEAIIKEEEEKAERAEAERMRRKQSKQKAKDRLRTEKEKAAAEREAKQKADLEEAEKVAMASKERDELERKRKAEELEEARKKEEQMMEERRKELLNEEDGYWRKRMAAEQEQRLLVDNISAPAEEAAEDSSAQSNVSDATHWRADDGFKDEARSSRRRGNRREKKAGHGPSTDDSSDAEPNSATSTRQGKDAYLPNGFSKVNGRPERRDRGSGDAKEGNWENGGERQMRQRGHMRSSPHDFSRGPERTGSGKTRTQPRVVPLPMLLPSDKGQARAEKQLQPERPASAAAGNTPSHRAEDPRPASARSGPSPPAAAAQAAAAVQDLPQSRAEPVGNAPQTAAAQPGHATGGQQEGRRRAQAQQVARPQPSKTTADEHPARPLSTPIQLATPPAAPVRPDTSASAATPTAKPAPPIQTAAPSALSNAAARAPSQAQASVPAAAVQTPAAAVFQHSQAPVSMSVGIPQPGLAIQAQPVVPVKALPQRPVPPSTGTPSAAPKKIAAEPAVLSRAPSEQPSRPASASTSQPPHEAVRSQSSGRLEAMPTAAVDQQQHAAMPENSVPHDSMPAELLQAAQHDSQLPRASRPGPASAHMQQGMMHQQNHVTATHTNGPHMLSQMHQHMPGSIRPPMHQAPSKEQHVPAGVPQHLRQPSLPQQHAPSQHALPQHVQQHIPMRSIPRPQHEIEPPTHQQPQGGMQAHALHPEQRQSSMQSMSSQHSAALTSPQHHHHHSQQQQPTHSSFHPQQVVQDAQRLQRGPVQVLPHGMPQQGSPTTGPHHPFMHPQAPGMQHSSPDRALPHQPGHPVLGGGTDHMDAHGGVRMHSQPQAIAHHQQSQLPHVEAFGSPQQQQMPPAQHLMHAHGHPAGMQQQLRGGLPQNMGASSMAHPSFSSRAMPDQHLQQQQQHQPSGVPTPAHLAMYPNMGMSLPQNGLQPHAGVPPFNNMGNLNGSPTYMMSNIMQNRHLGAAGPGQHVPPGQPQALPGPQSFPHPAAQLPGSQSRQAPSRSRNAQAAAMLRNPTALRASAREFVPGSFKPAAPAPQPLHGPKDVTPSEELVAIAAASAAAAAAHTTQMSQGHPAHARQLTQQPSVASLQQQQQQDSPSRTCPGQHDTEVLNKMSRLQQTQPSQDFSARQRDSTLQQVSGPPLSVALDTPASSLIVQLSSSSEVPAARSEALQNLGTAASQGHQQPGPAQRAASAVSQVSAKLESKSAGSAQEGLMVEQQSSISSLEKQHESLSQKPAPSVRPQQTTLEVAKQAAELKSVDSAGQQQQNSQQQQAQAQPASWSAIAAQGVAKGTGSPPAVSSTGRSHGSGLPKRGSNADLHQEQGHRSAHKPHQQAQGAPAPRSSPAHMMDRKSNTSSPAPTVQLRSAGDKRKSMLAGGVQWEGMGDREGVKRLCLVRGLKNDSGLNNCFLNVVIQCLWHLPSFREALLSLQPQDLQPTTGFAEDVRVLRALRNIFDALRAPREDLPESMPPAPGVSTTSSLALANGGSEVEARHARHPKSSWTESPSELREALSGLGKAAIKFELSEMHDAAEVLGELFNAIHRALLGSAAEKAADPQLPVKIRLNAQGDENKAMPNGMSNPKDAATPHSLVQRLFGLQVRVPSPPDGGEGSGNKRAKGSSGAVVGRWQETPSRSSSAKELRSAAPAQQAGSAEKCANASGGGSVQKQGRKPAPGAVDVLQFLKYFHLVPAQGLKKAYEVMIGYSFEEMLQEADSADLLAEGGSPTATSREQKRAVQTAEMTLLHRPVVFTLALVWDSPQASREAIHAVASALSTTLDLASVFKGLSKGALYNMRTIVCYFGHHYQAYVLSEELNEWLLFDDTKIRFIGSWQNVVKDMQEARLQPSLLFYECLSA